MTMTAKDRQTLESILYAEACDKITQAEARRQCQLFGFIPDLSDPYCNRVEVLHVESGAWHWVEV